MDILRFMSGMRDVGEEREGSSQPSLHCDRRANLQMIPPSCARCPTRMGTN
jgi:hypothetical protein